MIAEAMKPYGLSLLNYFEGDHDAEIIIRRDDGLESKLPVKHFFRNESELSDIELVAMDLCVGEVLDIGAGTGVHCKILESRGFSVTAIDVTSEAVDIMRKRGFQKSIHVDIFDYQGGPFDTLFMLGHGIGIVGDLEGLGKFLLHAKTLLEPHGQLLLDSLDVSRSRAPGDLDYHSRNRREGRYIGEISMQFQFRSHKGSFCRWLHIDQELFAEIAAENGWTFEAIIENEHGEYLAQLKCNSSDK